jgi:hypothetical protein
MKSRRGHGGDFELKSSSSRRARAAQAKCRERAEEQQI